MEMVKHAREEALIVHSKRIPVADLGVGADLAEYAVWVAPTDMHISSISVINGSSTAAGVDALNTSVHTVRSGVAGSSIVAETFDDSTTWPGANTEQSLGALSINAVTGGTVVTYQVTNGATANLPDYNLLIEWY